MYHITKEDVLAYLADAIDDPQLREAIEHARIVDLEVQHWFDLYDPDADEDDEDTLSDLPRPQKQEPVVVHRFRPNYHSKHRLLWRRAALGEPSRRSPRDTSTEWPLHRIDTATGVALLKHDADDIPYAVACVTARAMSHDGTPGREFGSKLVVFRRKRRGAEKWICVAEVPLAELGLCEIEPKAVELCLTAVIEDNLSEFSQEDLETLRDACNGDLELRRTVEAVLSLKAAQHP